VHVTGAITSHSKSVWESVILSNKNPVSDTTNRGVGVDPALPSELLYRYIPCQVFGRFALGVVVKCERGVSGTAHFRSPESVESGFPLL